MVFKSYLLSHSLHKHYYSQGMARFKGSDMQYGKCLGSIFKRVVLYLLSKGAKIAAPHVPKAAKGIGKELVGRLLMILQWNSCQGQGVGNAVGNTH